MKPYQNNYLNDVPIKLLSLNRKSDNFIEENRVESAQVRLSFSFFFIGEIIVSSRSISDRNGDLTGNKFLSLSTGCNYYSYFEEIITIEKRILHNCSPSY